MMNIGERKFVVLGQIFWPQDMIIFAVAVLLTMKGFIVRYWLDRKGEFEMEVGGYLQSGKLKNSETIVQGLDQAAGVFIGLFSGNNIGKMVVKLA